MRDFFEDLIDLVTIHVFALEEVGEEFFDCLDRLNRKEGTSSRLHACMSYLRIF